MLWWKKNKSNILELVEDKMEKMRKWLVEIVELDYVATLMKHYEAEMVRVAHIEYLDKGDGDSLV